MARRSLGVYRSTVVPPPAKDSVRSTHRRLRIRSFPACSARLVRSRADWTMSSPVLSGLADAMVNHVRVDAGTIETLLCLVGPGQGPVSWLSRAGPAAAVQVLSIGNGADRDNGCVWMRRRMKHALRAGTFTASHGGYLCQTASMWRDLRCHRA